MTKKKALALASRLVGPAFENYRRLTDDERTDYATIEASLKREFMSGGADRMQAVRELRQRKWMEGEEPIEAFAHEIARLVDLAYPESNDVKTLARDAFLEGLPPNFQLYVKLDASNMTKSLRDLTDVVHHLQLVGIGKQSRSYPSHLPVSHVSEPEMQSFMEVGNIQSFHEPKNIAQSVNSRQQQPWQPERYNVGRDRRRNSRRRFCYICGSPEHIRPNCPHIRDCHRCLKPGHLARNCTAPCPATNRVDQAKEGRVSNFTTASHGLILVRATIYDRNYAFLVDTGADVSLLPYSVVETNNLPLRRRMVRQPIMVDGSALRCEGMTDMLTLTIGPSKISQSFYVVRGLEYGILGTDILAHLNVQIDVATKSLYLHGQKVSTFETVTAATSSVCLIKFGQVYSPDRVVISPGEERTIWGRIHSNTPTTWTGVVEVLQELTERSGLLGCATVAEGGKEKNVPVRVLNVTEDPVTVYKGQSLAEFTEAMMNEGRTRDDATKTVKITYDPIAETTLGESISTEQKNRLERLLRRYNKVFAYPGNEGQVTHIEHTIPLTTDNPIACRPRRLPTQWRLGVEEEVQELQRRGVIRPSESGYAAPVCPIKKKTVQYVSV